MIDDWIGVLDQLPPSWRPWLLVMLQVMPLIALLLPLVKRWLGTPDPMRDPAWKTAVFYVLIALDWLALNSTPVREKIRQARASMPPRTSIPPGGGR